MCQPRATREGYQRPGEVENVGQVLDPVQTGPRMGGLDGVHVRPERTRKVEVTPDDAVAAANGRGRVGDHPAGRPGPSRVSPPTRTMPTTLVVSSHGP